MLRYIISISILLLGLQSVNAQFSSQGDEEESDTSSAPVYREPREPFSPIPRSARLGWDVVPTVRGLTNVGLSTWEMKAEVDFKQYIAVFEFGQWDNALSRFDSAYNQPEPVYYQVYNYQLEGNFFRVGIDHNFIHKSEEKSVFSFGLRWGHGWGNDRLIYGIDHPLWGLQTGYTIENQNFKANWLEMVTGLQVRLHPNFVMGYSARIKTILRFKDVNYDPFEVPGYGRSEVPDQNNLNWGFSYYFLFNLDFKKAPDFKIP